MKICCQLRDTQNRFQHNLHFGVKNLNIVCASFAPLCQREVFQKNDAGNSKRLKRSPDLYYKCSVEAVVAVGVEPVSDWLLQLHPKCRPRAEMRLHMSGHPLCLKRAHPCHIISISFRISFPSIYHFRLIQNITFYVCLPCHFWPKKVRNDSGGDICERRMGGGWVAGTLATRM